VLPVRPGPRSVTSAYFASTRDSLAMVPYIQSDVIEGPYLRLTIPLVMRSLLPRLEEGHAPTSPQAVEWAWWNGQSAKNPRTRSTSWR
jgi:hypothetical protein